jgi:hypothetical protein
MRQGFFCRQFIFFRSTVDSGLSGLSGLSVMSHSCVGIYRDGNSSTLTVRGGIARAPRTGLATHAPPSSQVARSSGDTPPARRPLAARSPTDPKFDLRTTDRPASRLRARASSARPPGRPPPRSSLELATTSPAASSSSLEGRTTSPAAPGFDVRAHGHLADRPGARRSSSRPPRRPPRGSTFELTTTSPAAPKLEFEHPTTSPAARSSNSNIRPPRRPSEARIRTSDHLAGHPKLEFEHPTASPTAGLRDPRRNPEVRSGLFEGRV